MLANSVFGCKFAIWSLRKDPFSMRRFLLIMTLAVLAVSQMQAQSSHHPIPISRQGFHDNIDKEQSAADKFDGKARRPRESI